MPSPLPTTAIILLQDRKKPPEHLPYLVALAAGCSLGTIFQGDTSKEMRRVRLEPRFTKHNKGTPVSAPNPVVSSETSKIKLSVVKGLRVGKSYALKDGVSYLGRKGSHAVDVDLTEQENPAAPVSVNRFALLWFDKNGLAIADTGRRVTRLNGDLIPSGKRFPLQGDDTLQFGKTVLQVKVIVKKRTGMQK